LEQIIFLTKKWKPAEKKRVIAIAQNRHDEVFFSKKILNNNYIDTRHLQLSSVKKSDWAKNIYIISLYCCKLFDRIIKNKLPGKLFSNHKPVPLYLTYVLCTWGHHNIV
jgi:hypothetical protein